MEAGKTQTATKELGERDVEGLDSHLTTENYEDDNNEGPG